MCFGCLGWFLILPIGPIGRLVEGDVDWQNIDMEALMMRVDMTGGIGAET